MRMGKKGIIKTRKEVHRTGEWHKVVFIFVVNSKGEIILQKRSAEKAKPDELKYLFTAKLKGKIDDKNISHMTYTYYHLMEQLIGNM